MYFESTRAMVRNLYINSAIAVVLVICAFLQSFLQSTTATEQIQDYMHLGFVIMLVAWIVFFAHCCGEIWLQLRKKSYRYLLTLLPFIIPLVILMYQSSITLWITAKIFS